MITRFTVSLLAVSLAACSQSPQCTYTGNFAQEANAGCLVINDNKVLFVEGNNGKLSLPGGGLSSGEAPQCTAEREVWEETGIQVTAQQEITRFDNGFQLFSCQLLDAQILDGSNRALRWRFEVEAIHWLAADEFDNKSWRFPGQVSLIKKQLTATK